MCSKKLLLVACWGLLLSGLRLTATTTTTTFVAAMSISNPDLERYFRSANISQPFTLMSEERIAMDTYTYAFLNYSYGDTRVDFDEEKARYGEGKEATVHGKLVHISKADDFDDDYACSSNIMGTGGKPTPEKGIDWIALVRRGRCTFEEKVKNVYEKGACGVIIYNEKSVINLEKMQIKGKWRNITAVITYHTIGLDMALKLDQGNDVYCSIIRGRSGMRPINSLNRTSVLFVSISFIVLMVISLVWLIFYYIQRFRYLQTKDQQSRQLCSVTKKAIMKIPTKTGKSSDEKDIDSDCCAICIEAYKSSDCIRVLPCKHEFHKNCIDPWLIEHRTCPMCKLDVLKFYGYVVGDQIYTTPNPQHIPPNLAPLDDNDVPVVVVAIPHSQSQQHQHEQQANLQQEQQGHLPQTLLPPALNASQSVASSSAAASTDMNTTCDSRYHIRNHSCSFNNTNHRHHINYGNKNCRSNCSCQNERSSVEPLMPNSRKGVRPEEMRRNSAPQLMQVPTSSSRQFIGSEESILDIEAERRASATARNDLSNNTGPSTLANQSQATLENGLTGMIRSRDFVIDFPRIFVLEADTSSNRPTTSLFPACLPERSQSSLSLDDMSSMGNKLEEQQGQTHMRKPSSRFQMQENLLGIRFESVRKRSRSADGRYSSGFFECKEHEQQQQPLKNDVPNLLGLAFGKSDAITGDLAVLRRNSDAIYELTEASYAESKQKRFPKGGKDMEVADCIATRTITDREISTTDVNITIQLNGEDVKLE